MNSLIKFSTIFLLLFTGFESVAYTQDINIKTDKEQILNTKAPASKKKLASDKEIDQYLKEKNIGRPEAIHEESSYWKEFTQMMMVLGAILIFLVTAGWFLKRMMRARLTQINFSSTIKILDKRALHPKACIYYVEVDGKRFVIGEGQNHLSILGEIPKNESELEPESPSFEKDKGLKFASFLKSCVSKKGSEKVEV